MRYLKSNNLSDKFQQPMIIYRLIEFDQNTNWTIEDEAIILVRTWSEEKGSNKENGDLEDQWATALLAQGFVESSEREFLNDIDGKEKT